MKTLSLLLVCALLGATLANTWVQTGEHQVEAHHAVSFKIGLKEQNMDTLDHLYWQLTDYNSPLFGKWLTKAQIRDLTALPDGDIQKVEAYLTKDSGKFCDVITRRSAHYDYIYVDTCAAQANEIFPNLDLAVYRKEGTNILILRHSALVDIAHNANLLGFPHELQAYVSAIHDVTDVPVHYSHVSGEVDPSQPWSANTRELTINNMIDLFGVNYDGIDSSSFAADDAQVRQGVIEFNNVSFSASELASFQSKYNLPNNPIRKVVGSEEEEGQSVEASLDVQTITGISAHAQTWDFVFDATASFIDVVNKLLSTSGAPKVYSCSWGSTESAFTKSQADAINNSFLKLASSGFTFLIASGDSGPTLTSSCNKFDPQFPATSAYVVAVGGTKLTNSGNQQNSWMHSSGGFSGYIPRPSFQEAVVQTYLNTASMPAGSDGSVYTTTGRAFPDVSAIGAYEPVLANGSYEPVGGTSGACPQFAAIITLINIHRYQKGLGPVGGLTKTLYGLKNGVGTDVTLGETYATNRSGVCGSQYMNGFNAIKGWDAATGLGSPVFSTLLDQLLNVPGEQAGKPAGNDHKHKDHKDHHHGDHHHGDHHGDKHGDKHGHHKHH